MVEEDGTRFLKKTIPRVAKAALWGGFYVLLLHLVQKLLPSEMMGGMMNLVESYIFILLFFAIAGSLGSGTIIEPALGFAKGLTVIAYTWITLNGGLLTLIYPAGEATITFTIDISIYLAMFILAELLGTAKNVLKAIDLLSEHVERPEPL